jgi:hypothetical protein
MLTLQEQLVKISTMLLMCPEPTIEDVEQADVFLVFAAERTWYRARADGPIFSTSNKQFEVLCIDFGFKLRVESNFILISPVSITSSTSHQVSSLRLLRLFPTGTEHIKNYPGMLSKFLLADVLVENQFQYKGKSNKKAVSLNHYKLSCIFCGISVDYVNIYLNTHITNQPVNAISLGRLEDYEVVRLFTKCSGQLLAKSLLDKNLVVQTETYKMALKNLPGDIHSMTPEGQSPTMTSISLSPISDTQFTVPVVKFYTSSSLDLNTNFFVTILSIQNGV